MEPYRPYGRGSCGHGANSGNQNQCGSNSRNTNACGSNKCGSNSRDMNNSRSSNRNYMSGRNNSMNTSYSNRNTGCPSNIASSSESGCKDNNKHMMHMPVGMAYVPMQKWGEMYDPETALRQGTAFPELNLIFCGSRGKM